jgi:hypothetical protein
MKHIIESIIGRKGGYKPSYIVVPDSRDIVNYLELERDHEFQYPHFNDFCGIRCYFLNYDELEKFFPTSRGSWVFVVDKPVSYSKVVKDVKYYTVNGIKQLPYIKPINKDTFEIS